MIYRARRAMESVESRGLACTARSDAHGRYELERAYVEMSPFDDREEFLEEWPAGRIGGTLSPFWVRFLGVYARTRHALGEG